MENLKNVADFRNVRRRLFQDDDEDLNSSMEENYANSFLEEVRKNRENAKKRWNFDFEKEEPLPGRYEWVKVDQNGRAALDTDHSSNGSEEFDATITETVMPNTDEDTEKRKDDKTDQNS